MSIEREPREPHPLEGKYIVFKYTEADYEREETFLLLYRVLNGRLQEFTSFEHFYSGVGSDIDERTFARLVKDEVTEVYTPDFRGSEFFGMKLGYTETLPEEEYDEEEGTQNWLEMETVENDGDYAGMLEDLGIKLVQFDMRSPEVRAADEES